MTRAHHWKPGRRGPGVVVGTLLAIALWPAVAEARPQITRAPSIAGTPQVGATLEARDAVYGGGTARWQWVRCDALDADENFRSCRSIPGATAITYAVAAADEGKYLRVMLVVRNNKGESAWALSLATSAISAAPAPAPAPSPSADPSPSPSPQPVTPAPSDPAAAPPPVVEVRDEQASKPTLMSPAPIVRIRGRLTRSGARITLLTVRAPRGARITVRCTGRGCPARRWARTASLTRVARFQAALPAGTRLVISVTKPGRIGKHTTIVIRKNKVPTRSDRCLYPGRSRPVACPAA